MTRNPAPPILILAAVLAAVSAQPFAGGWNDGSRLAAVESLAERGTLAIDDSVFVRVPPAVPGRPTPYPLNRADLLMFGTRDKLFIAGHYYSDKSPVPTVLMAAVFRGWLALGGPTFAERPDLACRFVTAATSGAAYVFAVWCVLRLGRRAGLSGATLALFGASFAFATVALPYTRSVNNHELLLAAVAGICVLMDSVLFPPPLRGRVWVGGEASAHGTQPPDSGSSTPHPNPPPQGGREPEGSREQEVWFCPVVAVGTLAGLGYATDLGAGPPLLVAVGLFLAFRFRGITPLAVFALAALPWVALHHALNYATGGTLGPANAVPEYLSWPGSPFTAETMTGGLKHSPVRFVLYAADLLVGQKGIVSNNLPLWLAVGGAVRLWLWHREARPVVAFAAGWCGCVWLLYSATSNNFGGQCCSVRWFVPFLAPGYWVLARLLAAEPRFARDLAWLAGLGVGMTALMWNAGPWMPRMVTGLWGWMAVAAAGWAAIRYRSARRDAADVPGPLLPEPHRVGAAD